MNDFRNNFINQYEVFQKHLTLCDVPRSNYICLPATVIDSHFKISKNYYLQTFLEKCKYKIKEKDIKSFIKNDLESSSNDDSEEENEDFQEHSE